MFKEERKEKILEILKSRKFASVNELSEILYYSLPTIRRDLTELERSSLVKRSHGGVMLADNECSEIPIKFRSTSYKKEKLSMCKKAVEFINENDVIFTDGSTTVLHIAEFLSKFKSITVVTNSLDFCNKINKKGIKAYCTGGKLINDSNAFGGSRAIEFVRDFRADVFLFSSSAIDEKGNITDYSEEETELRKAMMKNARVNIFMCHSSKFNKVSTFFLSELSMVDYFITDKMPDFETDGKVKVIVV